MACVQEKDGKTTLRTLGKVWFPSCERGATCNRALWAWMCALGSEPTALGGSPLKALSYALSRPWTRLGLGIFMGKDLLEGMLCGRSRFPERVDRK